jgi:hypothetical protein
MCSKSRERLVASIAELATAGQTVVVYGPVGIGKSWLLGDLARLARLDGRPCGLAERTATLRDIMHGLCAAYPNIDDEGEQRQLRSRMRAAIEAQPCLLLLDHVGPLGTAARGFLRHLRGTGAGVVLAADVANQRDHQALRALRLTHHEREVRPLPRADLGRLLDAASRPEVARLRAEDRERLLAAAEGRPGRLDYFLARLAEPASWRGNRVQSDALRADALVAEGRRYVWSWSRGDAA